MLRVCHYRLDGIVENYTYPGHFEAKLFQGGVLKILEPGEFDVPQMAVEGEDKGEPVSDIAVLPARVVAIFHSNYTVHSYTESANE
jgi:hypothetical protein